MNKKILKNISIIIGGTLVAIYGVFLLAPFIVNPIVKNYIPTVQEEIQKASGLKSTIEDFRIVTTPKFTVGAKIGEFKLATSDNKELLNADNFQVKMSLLPLLTKKIEVDVVSLNSINVNLGVNKDGSFYGINIPESNNETPAAEEAALTELPLGLKLSNHLPDIRVGNYNIAFQDLTTNKEYIIKGTKTSVTDFVLNKSIKVNANGSMVLAGREQFKYNFKLNNKIMPDDLDLNELIFNPQQQENQNNTPQEPINVIDIFKGLYNYQITANLDGDLALAKDSKKGYISLDNLSVINLPNSNAKLNFKGHKIDIDSNIYTAQNEVSNLSGTLNDKNINLNFKSGAELSNIVRIINAIAMTFNIKDLQTLTANGKLDIDCNIKSDFKKVNSNGYLRLPAAKLYYGLYDIAINDINADIQLDNNNINIKNVGFSILNQPLKFYGTISQNAVADLHLAAQDLSLKGLLIACGQGALLKENVVNAGTISLNADIKGKLDNIKPVAKVALNGINIKNIPSNTILQLPLTTVDIITDGASFSGTANSSNIKVVNPAASVNIPQIKANITPDIIEVPQSAVKIEKINLLVQGKIKNYMTEKIGLDFVTTGDIKSNLSGDMNMAKQTLNLNFAAQDSSIIVPMFDKSKMRFNGGISITGNMMNPNLTGTVYVPSLSIPEIPVTMDNLSAKLNGPILVGNATLANFTSGGIKAESITTDFSMKGENFYLNNLKGSAFDGKFNGNIIYNLNNAKTSVDFRGNSMNAEKAIEGAAGIKNALSGTLEFNTKMTLTVADYDEMMRSLKGNLSFKVNNGAFGSIGRLEHYLGATNVIGNALLKTTVATLSNLAGIKNTAEFDYILGSMTFANGWANLTEIKSTGKSLAYFVTGKYNLINGTTNVSILGRLDSKVVKLLGPIGELSADKLLSAIPKFGALTSNIVNTMTTDPKGERVSEIPALTGDSTGHKDFKVLFNGGIESKSSIKSFKWLTKVDTSALEQQTAVETIKALKTTVNTDVKTTVNTVKNVVDNVSSQKELIKNSASELKNLLKF